MEIPWSKAKDATLRSSHPRVDTSNAIFQERQEEEQRDNWNGEIAAITIFIEAFNIDMPHANQRRASYDLRKQVLGGAVSIEQPVLPTLLNDEKNK